MASSGRKLMHCSITNCIKPVLARGWCSKHYQRWLNRGDPNTARPKRPDGAGSIIHGYLVLQVDKRKAFEHVLIAERALGRKLPRGAQVHHADGNPANNSKSNLVICPDQHYHRLLHVRDRALIAGGNPDYRKCVYCKQHDAQTNLQKHSENQFAHRLCYNADKRQRRKVA